MSENQNIEWKQSWRDEYLKWVCGFANAQGGKIYIGIDDNGNVVGLKESKKLLEEIPNKITTTMGIVADINLLNKNGLDYIEIVVSPNQYPVSYKGEYHYRSGSTKQQLVGVALNQFLLKKIGMTWESVTLPNININELRNDSFDIFREQALKSKRMDIEDLKVENRLLMDNLNLLSDTSITRAGLLLFHHKPEKYIPGCFVKIAYFKSDSEILYQDEVHGSLLEQADKVVDLIYTKYLKGIISYENITRVENYAYPKEAVREAILNALAHKDYSKFTPIQIRVYDDKLMIANDCIFPNDWTLEDLMKPHKSRPLNPLIANAFFRAGFIESWGRGIQKISDSCIEAGNKQPEYNIKREDFTIIFSAITPQSTTQSTTQLSTQLSTRTDLQTTPQSTTQLNNIENKILELLKTEPNISQRQIAIKIGETYNRVRYHMLNMLNLGIIVKKGNNRSSRWVIKRD